MKAILAALLLAALGGCAGLGDALKLGEGRAYDAAAKLVSRYCQQFAATDVTVRAILLQEKRELRREIRQRGHSGPTGPDPIPSGLDGQTALGSGPVAVFWCQGTEVPENIWPLLERQSKPGEP